jgi:glycerol-3-phosphate dehydrogenase
LQRRIADLETGHFDVVVIGGGITGAWIGLDCAARGFSVAVIDQQDFAAGTSSKSSRLVHGGIRYLQQLRPGKARESALERAYLHRVAPHMTQFLPFIVPSYRSWKRSKPLLHAGMTAYQALCAGENRISGDPAKSVPSPFLMSRDQVLQKLPLEEPTLTGAIVYYESQMDSPERVTLAVMEQAYRLGAVCANYVKAQNVLFTQANKVRGILVEDLESGKSFEVSARLIVNAAGPWIPDLNRALFENQLAPAISVTGYSRGSHLVTRQLIADYAIALPTKFLGQNVIDRGGRHIFIIPWRGRSLIGTSYIATTEIDDPTMSVEEVDQLLGEINRQLPHLALTPADVVHAFSGIYPLGESLLNENVYQGSGDYQIVDHAKSGYKGMISALGVKFTTARLVAEKVTDRLAAYLPLTANACQTRSIRLKCADYGNLEHYMEQQTREHASKLNANEIKRMVRQYGSSIDNVLHRAGSDPNLWQPLSKSQPNLKAEVHHAVKEEMAIHLEDFIYRRSGIGMTGFPDDECISNCTEIMSDLLNWDARKCTLEQEKLNRYRRYLDLL